jgi:hypothetical protein
MATTKRERQLNAYVQQHCPEALRAGQRGRRAAALPMLTPAEKALIYHYTEDGFEQLNAGLHGNGGKNTSLFGVGLVAALTQLPAYEGEALSGVKLSLADLQHYHDCAKNGVPVRWPAFLSASQKNSIAMFNLRTYKKNCLFVIQSRTGRLIEEVAKFGVDGQNEYEVLFMPNTRFEVLAVVAETDYTRIVLDEL